MVGLGFGCFVLQVFSLCPVSADLQTLRYVCNFVEWILTYVRSILGQFLTFFSPVSAVGFIQAKVVRLFPPAKELVGSLFAVMKFELVFLLPFTRFFILQAVFLICCKSFIWCGISLFIRSLACAFLGLSEIRQILPVKGRMRVWWFTIEFA